MTVSHDFTTLDSCEDTSTWTYGGDASAPAVNTSEYVEGSGSLDLGKSGTSTTDFWYETVNTFDLNEKTLVISLYIASKDVLDTLSEVWIYLTDTSGNYVGYSVKNGLDNDGVHSSDPLRIGWNIVRIPFIYQYSGNYIPTPDDSSGSPDLTQLKIKILFRTNNASDTISSGDIKMDWVRSGGSIKFYGGTEASPYTKDSLDADVMSVYDWGFIDRRAEYHYIFYVAPTFTDYLGLSDVLIHVCYVKNYTLFDDNALGEVSGSIFLAHSGTSWWFRQSPAVSGNVSFVRCIFERRGELYSYAIWFNSGVLDRSTITGSMNCNADLENVGLVLYNLYVYNGKKLSNVSLTVEILYPYYGASTNDFVNVSIFYPTIIQASTAGNHVINLYDPVLVSDFNVDGSSGWFELDYYYSVKAQMVDVVGNPIVDATVNIYDDSGNLVGSTTTDSNGWMVDAIYVLVRRRGIDQSGNKFDETHNFKLEVVKDSTVYYSAWLNTNAPVRNTIKVYNAYTVSPWLSNYSLQVDEPLYIYAEVKDWSGTLLSGLDVYADITKPDLTVVTVTLGEYETGKYRAYFTDTDLVGTYQVKIYAVISNNTVESALSFTVGRIEQKIDNLSSQLKKHDSKLDAYKWMG